MHRRAAVRLVVAVAAVVAGVTLLARPAPVEVMEVVVPNDHRVLQMLIDERVPLLAPGDSIDLYLGTEGFAGVDRGVDVLDEPGLVVTVDETAFSVAVPQHHVTRIATALRDDGVLVVRR